MLEASALISLVVQGLRSNLWGLACPYYCPGPSISLAVACFLCGLLSGVALCAWFLLRSDLFPFAASTPASPGQSPPASASSRPRAALLGYLHGYQPRRQP